ncbi:hypothetical protein [Brevibacillus sp. NRS-1366]|uniref:hypothetical protein n=1 Tax=Brevibacillus sp. NRS-1366 TaxID=3233899 RepID=UPI003D1B3822
MSLRKKTTTSLIAASATVMMLTAPVFAAWSDVEADALVSFSNYSNYYKMNGTSKVTAYGSKGSGEALYNNIWITLDGGSYYSNDSLGSTNPSTLKHTTGQQGDGATWGVVSTGTIYQNGVPTTVTHKNKHDKSHPGM